MCISVSPIGETGLQNQCCIGQHYFYYNSYINRILQIWLCFSPPHPIFIFRWTREQLLWNIFFRLSSWSRLKRHLSNHCLGSRSSSCPSKPFPMLATIFHWWKAEAAGSCSSNSTLMWKNILPWSPTYDLSVNLWKKQQCFTIYSTEQLQPPFQQCKLRSCVY